VDLNTRISLRRLEVFCVVVEEGSVTRAAERLFVAQPAVSSQLRGLEQWLGAKLFYRRGNQRHLTEVGERTYEWAQGMLSRTLEIRRDVEGLVDGTGGTLVIASSHAVGTYLLPGVVAEFARSRPAAEITVRVAEPQFALHEVESGAADFAILTSSGRELPGHFHEEALHEEPIVLGAAPDGAPDSNVVTLEDAVQLEHVWSPPNLAPRLDLDRQLARHGVRPPKAVLRLGHAEAIKRAVRDYGWVCFFPRYTIEEELISGELREVTIADAVLTEHIAFVTRHDKRLSTLQSDCLEAIREYLADRTPEPVAPEAA
jgi:LysR family transcriptional regulator, low CO2-responsive transcriptional regulator